MIDVSYYVAQKIKYYRKLRRMTQKELGERVGVKHNTISSHEVTHKNKRGFTFGAVAYDRELSDKEVYDYELRKIDAPRELEEWELSIVWTRRD